ncbi:hypothetical protein SAMN05192541_10868 [Bradyrhizobium arachidis]|nr:hypothetical protein SAMN05192541_10868 [Bradyrhizobium arachidis]
MKARQNGHGSNEAPPSCENVRLSGRFLAKLVPLMEDVQQIRRATFARE